MHRLVLTGASGGLGRAIAQTLATRSSFMLLAGRDPARLHGLATDLSSRHSHLQVEIVSGDLTDRGLLSQLVERAVGSGEPINLLINNAGANDFHAFDSQRPDAVERLLAVNLAAPMLLTQALLPALRRAACAQIVNIGSVLGDIGYPGFSVYCATKFGLRGFSQALRRELAGTTVAVRYFAPRAIRTGLNCAAVNAMNRALTTKEDAPARVARALLAFLDSRAFERSLGFPERLYVFLNRMAPAINDRAIRAQLPIIRDHLPGAGPNLRQATRE